MTQEEIHSLVEVIHTILQQEREKQMLEEYLENLPEMEITEEEERAIERAEKSGDSGVTLEEFLQR